MIASKNAMNPFICILLAFIIAVGAYFILYFIYKVKDDPIKKLFLVIGSVIIFVVAFFIARIFFPF